MITVCFETKILSVETKTRRRLWGVETKTRRRLWGV